MRLHNTQKERRGKRQTRRRTLQAISGVMFSAGVVGTAGARRHTTEIDGPTVIDESGQYELVDDIEGEIKIVADDVTLEGNGYTISNGDRGIELNDVSDIIIRNMTINSAIGAIYANSASSITVKEVIGGVSSSGALTFDIDGDDNTFVDNEIQDGELAMRIFGSGNEVRNNDIDLSILSGISMRGDDNHIQQNNVSTGGTGISVSGNQNRVHANSVVDGNARTGIHIGGTDNTVTKNEAEGEIGIRVGSDNSEIVNNDAYGGRVGISLVGNQNKVIRNDVRDNEEGIVDEGENNLLRANITD